MSIHKMTFEQADTMLKENYHCSQCVICHAAELLGLNSNEMIRMMSGLGGGCFAGGTCGTVTASIAALGVKYGYDQPYAVEQNKLLVEKVHEFENRFKAVHGSLTCQDLLGGYNPSVPEQEKMIREKGLYSNCPHYCETACAILDEMLGDKDEESSKDKANG